MTPLSQPPLPRPSTHRSPLRRIAASFASVPVSRLSLHPPLINLIPSLHPHSLTIAASPTISDFLAVRSPPVRRRGVVERPCRPVRRSPLSLLLYVPSNRSNNLCRKYIQARVSYFQIAHRPMHSVSTDSKDARHMHANRGCTLELLIHVRVFSSVQQHATHSAV
jgi:hypothetical protein